MALLFEPEASSVVAAKTLFRDFGITAETVPEAARGYIAAVQLERRRTHGAERIVTAFSTPRGPRRRERLVGG